MFNDVSIDKTSFGLGYGVATIVASAISYGITSWYYRTKQDVMQASHDIEVSSLKAEHEAQLDASKKNAEEIEAKLTLQLADKEKKVTDLEDRITDLLDQLMAAEKSIKEINAKIAPTEEQLDALQNKFGGKHNETHRKTKPNNTKIPPRNQDSL